MSTELGTLVVVVLKARNLPDKHSFYKQDVFAQITLQGETKKTKIEIKGGQHPVWDEELRFPVYDKGKSGMMMEVSCWSKEPRSNDLVGKGELDISETLRTGEFDDWIPLSIETTQRGDLYLEMTFFAAGPPPALTRRPSKMKPAERLSRPQQMSPPRVANSHSQHSSVSPRPAQSKPLLPLAEEPPVPSHSPPPEDIPVFLRPGAGKGRSPSHRPTSSLSTTDYPPAQSPPVHGHRPSTSISSLSSNAGTLPAALRVGHGGSPTPVPQGTFVSDAQIPRLPSETLGGAPATSPPPPSVHNAYSYSSPQPYPPTTYSSPPPMDRPIQTLPPIAPPIIEHAPTPQPTWQAPQAAQPPPPQRYSPPQPSYSQLAPAQPPPQSYQQYNNTQPQYAPPLQPSTQPAVTLPGFVFPTPTVTPAPPPPAQSAPQNGGYRYPYGQYGPPASYALPYGAPHPQAYGPPQQHAQRPYQYNYPPPPREPDLDTPPLNSVRYQKPLPLPDEPAGGATPTPSRSRVDSSAHHRSSNGHHHTSSPSSTTASSHQKKPSREERKPELSREERDRQAAAQYEKEEAERRRIAREQEEKDAELARQLDIELNLQEENANANNNGTTGDRSGSPNNGNNNGMPGSWYRVRT